MSCHIRLRRGGGGLVGSVSAGRGRLLIWQITAVPKFVSVTPTWFLWAVRFFFQPCLWRQNQVFEDKSWSFPNQNQDHVKLLRIHGCGKQTLPTFFVTNGVVQREDAPLLKVLSVSPKSAVLLFVCVAESCYKWKMYPDDDTTQPQTSFHCALTWNPSILSFFVFCAWCCH